MEDDRSTSRALLSILGRRGWSVLLATTIEAALAQLDPAPDWVILDLMLPDGDGACVLDAVRAAALPTRVAITTGVGDPRRLADLARRGADYVMRKPINLGELLRHLESRP